MTRALVLLAALALALPAHAADPWSDSDKDWGAVALALTVIDWRQSVYIARHRDDFQETNHYSGNQPSIGRVNSYFAGSILAGAAIAHLLPDPYRKIFLGSVAVVEFRVVGKNFMVGVGIAY